MAQAGHWRRVVTIRPLAASPNLPTEPTPTPASASVAAARAARTPPAVAARRSTARDAVGGGGGGRRRRPRRLVPAQVSSPSNLIAVHRSDVLLLFFYIFLRAISSPVPARHVVWLRVVTVNLVSSSCRERERERETPSAGLDFCQLSHRVGEDTALTS